MARIYGHKWTSIVKVDDGTWLDGLRGISPDQVIEGLGRLVDEGFDWPPTLPEFKKLCKNDAYSLSDEWGYTEYLGPADDA